MREMLDDLLALIYPEVCPVCGNVLVKGEKIMCLSCRLSLPLTHFEQRSDWNGMMEKLLTLHAPVSRAAAYFYYQRESPHSHLIHHMKYNGMPSMGRDLMREYAATLSTSGFFDGIDAITAVPLSLTKLIKRGYNQSFRLAQGVRDVTALPIIDALRAGYHRSQTRLGADDRLKNARNIYSAKLENLRGVRHLLVIDDIVTTGATLCSCLEAIHKVAPSVELSVLALASTRLQ